MHPNHYRVAQMHLEATSHKKSIVLMTFLADLARSLGVGRHVYVVGGAVRNFVIDEPIKDIDVVIDSLALGGGRDSEWFAKKVVKAIPVPVNMETNQYGVALLHVKGDWILDGDNLKGEDIEIANARKESYGGAEGKGYRAPHGRARDHRGRCGSKGIHLQLCCGGHPYPHCAGHSPNRSNCFP